MLFRSAGDINVWFPVAQLRNASKNGDEETVRKMLDQGVDPNMRDCRGRTPLWWSAWMGFASITDLLLKRDKSVLNEPDIDGRTPLHEAAKKGHKTIVELLLNTDGIDPELVDYTRLTAQALASINRNVEIVHILRDHVRSKTIPAHER